jgi:hypothetical protein
VDMTGDIVSNSVTNFGEPMVACPSGRGRRCRWWSGGGMIDTRDPDDIISRGAWHHDRIGLSKCILKCEDKTITRHLCNILNKINISKRRDCFVFVSCSL